MNTQKGYLGLIIVLVVAIFFLIVLGYNPMTLWQGSIVPILESVWSIIGNAIVFLIEVVVWIVDKLNITN